MFAHTLIAVRAARRGLDRLALNRAACARDLDAHYEVLGEALQTVMRKHGVADAYERIKRATRGKAIDRAAMREIIVNCDIPAAEKERLLNLKPADYTGLAAELARGQKTTKS